MLPLDDRKILSFTCFWATESQLATAIRKIISESDSSEALVEQAPIAKLPLPQFYNPPCHEVYLWKYACGSAGTIFYPNLEDGWVSLVRCIIKEFHYRAVSVRVSAATAEYPICEFDLQLGNGTKRFVRVMRDDPKWQFYCEGPVQPFERVELYQARLIKKRFTIEMLCDYLAALGWPIGEAEFWMPPRGLCTKIVEQRK